MTIEERRQGSGRPPRRLPLISVAAVSVALAADQLSKSAAFDYVARNGPADILPVLTITAGMNPGVAFGFAVNAAPILLIAVAVILCGWIALLIWRSRWWPHQAALGLALGGAIGNIVDRVRFGAVRDLIDAHWGSWHWPTFNLADAFIVCGLLLALLVPDRLGKPEHGTKVKQARPT